MLKNKIWKNDFLAGPAAMGVLIVFQILFVLSVLLQSSYVYYRIYTTGYHTLREPIGSQLLGMLAILIAAELLVWWCFQKLAVSATPVIVPLFILLTISTVYQSYVRRPENAVKHFVTILLGLAVMLFSMCFIRVFSRIRISDRAFRCMLYACWGLCLLNIVMGLAQGINNAGAFLSIGWINVQPGEFLKLLTIFLVGIGFCKTLRDKLTSHLLLLTMLIELCTLVMVRDIGNAFILLLVVLTVVALRYSIRISAALAAVVAVLATLGYSLLSSVLSSDNRILWRISNTFQALTVPLEGRVNRDIRTALFAALRGGIFGVGMKDNVYVLYNSYIYTDFVFDIMISFFGAAAALLAVFSIVLLILHSRTDLKHAGQDIVFYVYSNLMVIILGVQAIVHVGGNLNVIPFTGVVFPFLSSGGSAMVASFLELGLALGGRVQNPVVDRLRQPLDTGMNAAGGLLEPVLSKLDGRIVNGLDRLERWTVKKTREIFRRRKGGTG